MEKITSNLDGLYYELWPGTQGTLLTLINGTGRPQKDFLSLIRKIKNELPQLPILTLDNRGIGESLGVDTRGLTISDMSEDVLNLWRQLGFHKHVGVGLSMGGLILQDIALKNLESKEFDLRHMVLISTFSEALDPKQNNGPEAAVQMQAYVAKSFFEKNRPLVAALQNSMDRLSEDSQKVIVNQRLATRQYDYNKIRSLRAYRGRVTVLHGHEDQIVPPEYARRISQLFESSKSVKEVLLPSCGHLLLAEAPTDVASQVLEALKLELFEEP